MRELTYYVACSIDGFIARTDGSFDYFLGEGDHLTDLIETFPETIPAHVRSALHLPPAHNRWFDAVLMGRKTYQVGAAIGITSPYPTLAQYVFARSLTASPDPAVELVTDDPLPFVQGLKQQDGLGLWLCGGAALAAALAPAIDELVLKINPVVVGAGIPLFAGALPTTRFALTDSKRYDSGVVMQRYRRSDAP